MSRYRFIPSCEYFVYPDPVDYNKKGEPFHGKNVRAMSRWANNNLHEQIKYAEELLNGSPFTSLRNLKAQLVQVEEAYHLCKTGLRFTDRADKANSLVNARRKVTNYIRPTHAMYDEELARAWPHTEREYHTVVRRLTKAIAEWGEKKGKTSHSSSAETPTSSHVPHHEEEEEISRFKKMGKWIKEHPYKTGGGALGATAAVGGLGYAGYKLFHRKKDTSNEGMLSFEEFVLALEEDEDSDDKGYLSRAKDAVFNQALSHPLRTAGIAAGTAAVGIGTGIHISNKGAYYLRIREKIKKNEPLSEEEIEAMKHLLKKKDGKTNSVIQEILDLFKNHYAHRL